MIARRMAFLGVAISLSVAGAAAPAMATPAAATATAAAVGHANAVRPLTFTGWGQVRVNGTAVRTCPHVSCGLITRIPVNTWVFVSGEARGDNITDGPFGPTNCWDFLRDYGGYATDAYIFTGVDSCA